MSLQPFDLLLVDLAESLLFDAGDARGSVAVHEAELAIPLEARLAGDGGIAASLPRWRTATGFEPALHRVRLRIGAAGEGRS